MLIKKIADKYINHYQQKFKKSDDDRKFMANLSSIFSIFGNILIFVVKFVLGFITGSVTLIADAFHTLSDIGTSAVIIIGFKISEKPADKEHPFGHGRAEYIVSLVVALLLIVSGYELAKKSIVNINTEHEILFNWYFVLIVFLTIVLKEFMAFFSERISERITSSAVKADAWHHHSDAISTGLVIAAMIGGKFGFKFLDSVTGFLISLYIAYIGIKIALDSANSIIGTPPSDELLNTIKTAGANQPDIKDIHDIIVNCYGNTRVISFHISVDSSLSLCKAHHIAEVLENEISEKLNSYVVIHVDPVNLHDDFYMRLSNLLKKIKEENKYIINFHDLRVNDIGNGKKVYVDIVPDDKIGKEELRKMKCEIEKLIKTHSNMIKEVEIIIEPNFAYN